MACDRWDEALRVAEHAVDIRLRLVQGSRPGLEQTMARLRLAGSLSVVSSWLSRLDHRDREWEEAITANAVRVLAELRAHSNSNWTRAMLEHYARALELLADSGAENEAVSAITEAIPLFEKQMKRDWPPRSRWAAERELAIIDRYADALHSIVEKMWEAPPELSVALRDANAHCRDLKRILRRRPLDFTR